MSEQIYTIPINEAFDACAADHSLGCPFCRLYNRYDREEVGLILGASMMEPDVRIQTNEKGFCPKHFNEMFHAKNRLGLALILESHLNQLREEVKDKGLTRLVGKTGTTAPKRLHRLHESCYVCDRLTYTFTRVLSNAVALYTEDEAFKDKIRAQPYICLPHLQLWLETAQNELKKDYAGFYEVVTAPSFAYFDELRADVSWFCKKFDYRYDAEPWGNAKDAVERAGKFLEGNTEE